MMYDIIVFENDRLAFSKKPTLVTIFGNLFFFSFLFFFPAAAGDRGGGPENAVYETPVRVYTSHFNIDCRDVATIGGLKQ